MSSEVRIMLMTPPGVAVQMAGPLTANVLPSANVWVAKKSVSGVADKLNGPAGVMVMY